MANQTVLEAILPEIDILERYLSRNYDELIDIDKKLTLHLAKSADAKIYELGKTYDLCVLEEEYVFEDEVLDFFIYKKAKLTKRKKKPTAALPDAIMELRTLSGFCEDAYNGKSDLPAELGSVFLLLVRAAKEKLKYFQEKYSWEISKTPEPARNADPGA